MDRLKLNQKTENPNKFIEDGYQTELTLGTLTPVSYMDVINMVKSIPPKSCDLDPIPTKILKNHINALAHGMANTINTSFEQGYVCDSLKEAIIRPFLKSPKLDLVFPNFRPVSNLAYLGKFAERFVCQQLIRYAELTDMMEPFQSAYREGYLTETALLCVKTDILDAMDRKEVTCLVMLDLSAAFDTVSYKLLINHLKYCFGITDTILQWISSYLTNRSQRVMVYNELGDVADSSRKSLEQGIPQSSTLGPILFNLFMSPLGGICQAQRISFAGYTDDTQNHMSFRPLNNSSQPHIACINKLELCLEDIRSWMQVNFLKLNESKTEFIIFGMRQQLNKVGTIYIKIGEDPVQNVTSVRNLGLHFDEELKHSTHVNKLTSISFNMIHNISRIFHLLDMETTKTLVQALVLSCLDYCNSMLLGIPNYNIQKLQQIQSMSARIVLQLP